MLSLLWLGETSLSDVWMPLERLGSPRSAAIQLVDWKTTIVYWVNMGIMENKMETTLVDWCNMGRMESQMETT